MVERGEPQGEINAVHHSAEGSRARTMTGLIHAVVRLRELMGEAKWFEHPDGGDLRISQASFARVQEACQRVDDELERLRVEVGQLYGLLKNGG